MHTIAIIGAGQIGSRHLQALALSNYNLNIQIVDPYAESLKNAQKRFDQVNQNFTGNIAYFQQIKEIHKKIDIVIVATTSIDRRKVVEDLLQQKRDKY